MKKHSGIYCRESYESPCLAVFAVCENGPILSLSYGDSGEAGSSFTEPGSGDDYFYNY